MFMLPINNLLVLLDDFMLLIYFYCEGSGGYRAVGEADINQFMEAMSLRADKRICSIHCWQHMRCSEIFEYEPDTVTLENFLLFMNAKFSKVISFSNGRSVKVYIICQISKTGT